MTVSVQTPLNTYTANGTTTVFPFTFKISANTDINVYVNSVLTTTGFAISDIVTDSGGSVNFIDPPLAGQTITIKRITPINRTVDYIVGGTLDANSLDADIDRVVLILQEINYRLSTLGV